MAANSQDQLRDTIWPEIGKWHRQLPEDLKAMIDVQAERIVVVHDRPRKLQRIVVACVVAWTRAARNTPIHRELSCLLFTPGT